MIYFLPKKQLLLLAGDLVLTIVSFYLAPMVRFGMILDLATVFDFADSVAILMYPLIFYIFDFYNLKERTNTTAFLLHLMLAIMVINFLNTSFFYLFSLHPYSTGILAISALLSLALLAVWRSILLHFLSRTTPIKALILGTGATGNALHDYLRTRKDYEEIGFVEDTEGEKAPPPVGSLIIGRTGDLPRLVKGYDIDQIIVTLPDPIRPEVFSELVDIKFSGVEVFEVPTFYERIAEKIPVLHTSNMWLGFADIAGVKRNVYNTKLKKVFDKLISVAGLILAMPLMALTFLLIKVDSPGPALYRQERVGWNEKTFDLIKFRSMRTDAETNGAVWAQENDPRITRIGSVIRLLRLDELPQLWNVLKGDMSFVGPRPERMAFILDLKRSIPHYGLRHSIKPGITGWAQVNYPYGASKQDSLEKLQYDLYYIKNMSILLDIYIILRTCHVMLFQKGAR